MANRTHWKINFDFREHISAYFLGLKLHNGILIDTQPSARPEYVLSFPKHSLLRIKKLHFKVNGFVSYEILKVCKAVFFFFFFF